MRISGTGPLSVILSQSEKFKMLKSDTTEVAKQADDVINPQNYDFDKC